MALAPLRKASRRGSVANGMNKAKSSKLASAGRAAGARFLAQIQQELEGEDPAEHQADEEEHDAVHAGGDEAEAKSQTSPRTERRIMTMEMMAISSMRLAPFYEMNKNQSPRRDPCLRQASLPSG